MRAEFMGEGNYTYECNEPGCWFCEMMGLKPPVFTNVPRKIRERAEVFVIPMAVLYDQPHLRPQQHISPATYKRKLRQMGLPHIGASFMKHDKTY